MILVFCAFWLIQSIFDVFRVFWLFQCVTELGALDNFSVVDMVNGIWIKQSGAMVFIFNVDKVSLKKPFPTMNI